MDHVMILFLEILVAAAVLYGVGVIIARLAFPLPSLDTRSDSKALAASEETTLGALVARDQAEHPGKTGVLGISEGHGALASRLLLARRAEASIDALYYIWNADTSGRLLMKALFEAAERGVRVRLLLDDNGTEGLDDTLAALAKLSSFEVRLFNPSPVRNPKFAGYFFDFFRMNRRMHNKAFIVDGAVAIVGGRNIADEYFQLSDDGFFLDLDVLAAGAVVPDTAAVFDAYWNSASAYPVESIVRNEKAVLPGWLTGKEAIGPEAEVEAMSQMQGTAADRFVSRDARLEWVDAEVIADDPAKGVGKAPDGGLMIDRLREVSDTVSSSLDLVSAYFIPGRTGVSHFAEMARRGVKQRILTNAFVTTDVKLVHAGYAKYRRDLLKAGIALSELKPDAANSDRALVSKSGSSAASLHAKTLAIDGRRIFVGSFNFDPRSALLNCEMGFMVDSPALAERMVGRFDEVATATFSVRLEGGSMRWTETGPGGETVHEAEPGMTTIDRWFIGGLGRLPIEWLL